MPIKPTEWIKTDKPVFICPNQACGAELELHGGGGPDAEDGASELPDVALCPNCEFIDDIDWSEIPPLI